MSKQNCVKIEYSDQTEAQRIYFELGYVFNEFFVENQWYVLPTLGNYKIDDPVVILPRLNYFEILDGIKTFKFNEDDFKKEDYKVIKKTQNALIKTRQFKKIDDKKLKAMETRWQKMLLPILEKAQHSLYYLKNKKTNITIKPSNFGTCGSFSLFDVAKENVGFEVRPRLDQKPEEIVELVTSSLTRSALKDNPNVKWRETEAVSDFFTQYVFGVKNHSWTLDKVTKRKPDLLRKSTRYLMELGLPTGELLKYNSKKNKITLINDDITDVLAPYEFRLLRGLIENRNTTLSYNYMAEELYNSHADVKFSLWGITKTVQRVRDKLEDLGVPRETIINVKGEGFKLVV